MIKQIIYTISIISLILLTIITVDMLPFIYQSKLQGLIFLLLVIALLIGELYTLIKYKKVIKKNICYNTFLILTTMYIVVIYYRIYSFDTNVLYSLDLKYLRFNYLILSVALLMMIIDLYIVIKEHNKKVNL